MENQLSLFSGLTIDDAARPTEAHLKIAKQREWLVKFFLNLRDLGKKDGDQKASIESFLKTYNEGTFPFALATLGRVSRATFYNWLRDYREGGFDALIPGYSIRPRRISKAEKRCLAEILADGISIGQAIFIAKYFLKRRKTESPSSPATLRRWAKKLMEKKRQEK